MRLSFTGDIMCELPTLRKVKKNNFNFEGMFSETNIFSQTDYLIGNLESVLAGKNLKYSRDIYSYNTPDTIVNELKKSRFNMLTTANNHCLDRGAEGLTRTMDILKNNKIEYIGTNMKKTDVRYRIIELEGIKIGFLAYTYGSNYSINKQKLTQNNEYMVNFFEEQDWIDESRKDLYSKVKEKLISAENRVRILRKFKKTYNRPRVDNKKLKPLDNKLLEDVKFLKKNSDFVILMMHSGGQFNRNPGMYTLELVKQLQLIGVDFVIGHHPHVVQKCEFNKNKFVAYSLGNFFLSPDTVYLIDENLPLYSIVLHIDINNKNDYEISFSISKTIKEESFEKVADTYDLFNCKKSDKIKLLNDCKQIYKTFTGKENFQMQKEYKLLRSTND